MYCPSCGQTNPESLNHCQHCQQPLPLSCTHCQHFNPPKARFCLNCGQPMEQQQGASQNEAERRQLTVMFCDLVGSTALSKQLDPEELSELIRAFQQGCEQVIHEFDGYIARYMGDGLLVYFGYPTAHEHDAERSLHAALAIVDRISRLNHPQAGALQVRIGIETGLVVAGDIVGNGQAQEHTVLGDTPNLAARLQNVAPANGVVIGPGCQRLVAKLFLLESLGPQQFKGIEQPVCAYRVEATRELSPDRQQGLLIGRDGETRQLQHLLRNPEQGAAVLILGEPGLGKSQLLKQFLNLAADDYQLVLLRCSPFYQDRPLYPVIRHWRNLLDRWPEQIDAPICERFKAYLGSRGVSSCERLELLAQVLFPDQTQTAVSLSADQRTQVLNALAELVIKFSQIRPLLLAIEDSQWIDSSTAALMTKLADQCSQQSLLICATSRSEPDWLEPVQTDLRLSLEPLPNSAANQLIDRLCGDQPLPNSVRREIVERAEGSPLYLEELTKAVLEQADNQAELLQVPSSLQDSLRERLDRLGPVKKQAQFIAVIGRHFSQRLVLACSPREDQQTLDDLQQLVDAQILCRSGGPHQIQYAFKHTLLQEVAYNSLLHRIRHQHHQRIAQTLVDQFSEIANESPELIARHLQQAQQPGQAIGYWLQAARQAVRSWSHIEAINHYQQALALVEQHPDASNRAQEIDIRLGLVQSLRFVEQADQGLEQLERLKQLAAPGQHNLLAKIYNLGGNLLFGRGDIDGCLHYHQQAIDQARQAESVSDQIRGLSGVGDANMLLGRLITAVQAYDICVELSRKHQLPAYTAPNLALRGHLRLHLNRLDDSHQDLLEAIDLAQQQGDKRTEMIARGSCLAKTLCERAEYLAAWQQLKQALVIARELAIPRFESLYLIFQVRSGRHLRQPTSLQPLADEALAIARNTDYRFIGSIAFSAQALIARPDQQLGLLEQGEALLDENTTSQNYLWFLRDAIEVCLGSVEPQQALHYAQLLEDYTAPQPLPWSELYIELARSSTLSKKYERQQRLLQLIKHCRQQQMPAARQLAEQQLQKPQP